MVASTVAAGAGAGAVAAEVLRMLLLLFAIVGWLPRPARAEFTVGFDRGIEQGKNVLLEWEPVDAKYYPLVLFGQAFNRTGKDLTSIEQNITSRCT